MGKSTTKRDQPCRSCETLRAELAVANEKSEALQKVCDVRHTEYRAERSYVDMVERLAGRMTEEKFHWAEKARELEARLVRIAEIIEHVDNRCMVADGPVPPTLQEMTQPEMSEIYALATGKQEVG